jgi:hypothetical protein
MSARDAVRMTGTWRLRGRRRRGGGVPAEPWSFTKSLGADRYHGAWQVRLNADDGRVWLRPERQGRFAEAGDPYP